MEATARNRRTRFGAFDVDLRSGELHKHGIRLKLQDQPFQVLALVSIQVMLATTAALSSSASRAGIELLLRRRAIAGAVRQER